MLDRRIARAIGALAAVAATPALAQELQVDFISLSPVPVGGWVVAAIAGALALAAHRALRGRARTLGVMAATAVAAGTLAWNAVAPAETQAAPVETIVNLATSPATVALVFANQPYKLVNVTARTIKIVSIERVNASAFTFIVSPLPACGKQQELRPGEFCYVALGPIEE
jgi:hypothetical protein